MTTADGIPSPVRTLPSDHLRRMAPSAFGAQPWEGWRPAETVA